MSSSVRSVASNATWVPSRSASASITVCLSTEVTRSVGSVTRSSGVSVRLDGEVREAIRQRRIVDDWRVLADSLHDPVPNVNGERANIVGKDIGKFVDQPIEFDVGDSIELQPNQEDADP